MPLDTATFERWMGGTLPAGAVFRLSDSVEITEGPHLGRSGAVISSLTVDPEPSYSVELDSGDDVEVRQRWLRVLG